MTKYTTQNHGEGYDLEIKDDSGLTVASLSGYAPEFLAMALAAPDMLEALEDILANPDSRYHQDKARAAITKAKGEV